METKTLEITQAQIDNTRVAVRMAYGHSNRVYKSKCKEHGVYWDSEKNVFKNEGSDQIFKDQNYDLPTLERLRSELDLFTELLRSWMKH